MERRDRLHLLRRSLAGALAVLGTAPAALGAVYETQEKALARAFPPPARVVRTTSYLSEGQVARAQQAARAPVSSAVVTRYAAFGPGNERLGTVYFDTHAVRTATETLMIQVRPDGRLGPVDVLAFAEPEDYLPRTGWLRRAEGQPLGDELFVGRALAHVTGATLTTRAITLAVRRALALEAVLGPAPFPGPVEGKR